MSKALEIAMEIVFFQLPLKVCFQSCVVSNDFFLNPYLYNINYYFRNVHIFDCNDFFFCLERDDYNEIGL